MSDTPRTDVTETFCYGHIDQKWTPAHFARKLERELAAEKERSEGFREVLADVSTYLSVGSGDENTTAKKYMDRIMDGMKLHNDQSGKLIAELTEQLAAVTAERDALKGELNRVKTKCVAPALFQLEKIRTEQVMAAGLSAAANCISHARVALGDTWPEVDQNRDGYVDDLSASQQEVARLLDALGYVEACGERSGWPRVRQVCQMVIAGTDMNDILRTDSAPVRTDTERLDWLITMASLGEFSDLSVYPNEAREQIDAELARSKPQLRESR